MSKTVFRKNKPAVGALQHTLSPMGGDEQGCPYVWPGKVKESASTPVSPHATSQRQKGRTPVRGD